MNEKMNEKIFKKKMQTSEFWAEQRVLNKFCVEVRKTAVELKYSGLILPPQ